MKRSEWKRLVQAQKDEWVWAQVKGGRTQADIARELRLSPAAISVRFRRQCRRVRYAEQFPNGADDDVQRQFMSVRLRNALAQVRCRRISDIRESVAMSLLRVRNFGRKSAEELVGLLNASALHVPVTLAAMATSGKAYWRPPAWTGPESPEVAAARERMVSDYREAWKEPVRNAASGPNNVR